MSTRSFFDIRYTIPGYTFILYFILLNLEPFAHLCLIISASDSNALFGVIFGFITLLSGAALGFLVSQPWHAINNRFLRNRPYNRVNKIMNKTLSLAEMDYRVLSADKKQHIDYLMRRWDLYNLMGSIISSIVLGSIFGGLINSIIQSDFKTSLPIDVVMLWFYLSIFSIIIIVCFLVGMHNVVNEWVEMSTQIIGQEPEVKNGS